MKYLISEKQLRLITEEEDTEDYGRLFYVMIKIPKTSEVTKETHPEMFKTEYTKAGYPMPVKRFKGDEAMLKGPDDMVYLYTKLNDPNEKKHHTRILTAYQAPDGEFYIPHFYHNSNTAYLMHLNKNLIEEVNKDSEEIFYSKETFHERIDPFYSAFKENRRSKIRLVYRDENGKTIYEKEID